MVFDVFLVLRFDFSPIRRNWQVEPGASLFLRRRRGRAAERRLGGGYRTRVQMLMLDSVGDGYWGIAQASIAELLEDA